MLCAAPPGHPLQKRTVVQWDIDGVLSADYAADESVSPQFGISRHDDMLRENFPCGWSVSFFGKWRVAGLKLRPSVIEGGNQNLHFLRVKDAVGKSLDKPVHRDPPKSGSQAAARTF